MFSFGACILEGLMVNKHHGAVLFGAVLSKEKFTFIHLNEK